MKYFYLLVNLLSIYFISTGQVTIKIENLPDYYTPINDTLFISGNFNNWAAADTFYRMQAQADGTYKIIITSSALSSLEFKFTRGSWNNVETQLDGSFLPNRSVPYVNGAEYSFTIENWNDMTGWHTAVGNTKILDLDFYIPQLNRNRRIWVYFPQDYFTSNNFYPVLYMHDAQNLFDLVYAFGSEWNVDAAMEAMFGTYPTSAIIVAIDNGGAERLNEYSPWVNLDYGGGEGDLYTNFIVNTLKPYIDLHFRTKPEREYTGIMGSSMGGLISFYAAIKHQDVFSKAGIFSPSFWFSDSIYSFINENAHQNAMKFYFLAGDQESGSMISDINNVIDTMLNAGFNTSEMHFEEVAGGQHSEWFWEAWFSPAFQWLFDGITAVNNSVIYPDLKLYYNPSTKIVFINDKNNKNYYEIVSLSGVVLYSGREDSNEINVSFLKQGFYFFKYGKSVIKIAVL